MLVLDTSASMEATDVSPSRIDVGGRRREVVRRRASRRRRGRSRHLQRGRQRRRGTDHRPRPDHGRTRRVQTRPGTAGGDAIYAALDAIEAARADGHAAGKRGNRHHRDAVRRRDRRRPPRRRRGGRRHRRRRDDQHDRVRYPGRDDHAERSDHRRAREPRGVADRRADDRRLVLRGRVGRRAPRRVRGHREGHRLQDRAARDPALLRRGRLRGAARWPPPPRWSGTRGSSESPLRSCAREKGLGYRARVRYSPSSTMSDSESLRSAMPAKPSPPVYVSSPPASPSGPNGQNVAMRASKR